MPQNARINQTDATADYANTVLWEAGEEGSDYGSVTIGIQEDFYIATGRVSFIGTWANSFQLIAKVGEEADASDITQGAGFGDVTQFIDVRVPNGEFKNIRIDGMLTRILGTSTNTKLTNCVGRGSISTNIADDLFLDNTLFISDAISDTISIRDTPATLNKSTVISLNDTGGHVLRSRGTSIVNSNDSVCFAPNTAISFATLLGGAFTGDFNAGHTGGSTPGANSVTNLTRTVTDVFTDPAGNDYTPKVGGPLDGASSTGGFIGAFAPTGSGVTVTATLGTIDYTSQDATVALTGSIDLTTTLGAISYSSQNTTISLTGAVDVTATLGSINYSSQNTTVSVTGYRCNCYTRYYRLLI